MRIRILFRRFRNSGEYVTQHKSGIHKYGITCLPERVTRSLAVTLTFEELDQVGVRTKVLGNSVGKLK